MVVGLWASAVLPGVGIGGGSVWRQLGSVLGAAVISAALWGLGIAVLRIFGIVRAWLGRHVTITYTTSLAFPALTRSIPGSGTLVDLDAEVSGPAVESFGRALRHLLLLSLALAVLPVQFWTTGMLAREAGLGFEISGVWSVVGGCVIANLVYVAVVFLGLLPRLARARAAADRHYLQAQAGGLDADAARVEARQVYDQAMKAGRDRDAPRSGRRPGSP
jgi:hypothetical protein